jgi:hypothetical protein
MSVVDYDCEIIPTFIMGDQKTLPHLILALSKVWKNPTTNKFFESLKLQKLKPSSFFFLNSKNLETTSITRIKHSFPTLISL